MKCGIPVYASEETHGVLPRKYQNQIVVHPGYWYRIGNFEITPFEVVHDVVCYGYLIKHPDMGILLFATDSSYVKQNFQKLNLNHILVECNYSIDIVNRLYEDGSLERSRIERILKTHMELNTCLDFLTANKTANLDNVILLHMSDGNSNATQFVEATKKVVRTNTNVYEAKPGLEVKLDLFPFA